MLCLDVGPSMNISPPAGGETRLEMAIKIINQIVQQKVRVLTYRVGLNNKRISQHCQIFAGGKDLVGLVLFGTPGECYILAA